jgi:hypothetical protein
MPRVVASIPTDKWHPGRDANFYTGVACALDWTKAIDRPSLGIIEAFDRYSISHVGNLMIDNDADIDNFLPNNFILGHVVPAGYNVQYRHVNQRPMHIASAQALSVSTFQFLAREGIELTHAIESLKLFALNLFPGSGINTSLYTDPEEGWQKLVFEVSLAPVYREHAFELEEQFVDAVCEAEEYATALRKLILQVR